MFILLSLCAHTGRYFYSTNSVFEDVYVYCMLYTVALYTVTLGCSWLHLDEIGCNWLHVFA